MMCLVLWQCIALPKPGGLRDHSQVDEAEASAGIQLCVQVLSPCACSSGAQPLATNTPGSCRAPAGGANLLCTASTSPSHCSSWPAALPCMARARLHTCPQSWGGEASSKNVPKRERGLLLSGCKLRGDTHVPTPPRHPGGSAHSSLCHLPPGTGQDLHQCPPARGLLVGCVLLGT